MDINGCCERSALLVYARNLLLSQSFMDLTGRYCTPVQIVCPFLVGQRAYSFDVNAYGVQGDGILNAGGAGTGAVLVAAPPFPGRTGPGTPCSNPALRSFPTATPPRWLSP